VHPSQLYEAGALLLIGVALNVLYPRRAFAGQITLTYLLLYAGARTVTEAFRGDDRGFFLEGILGQTLSFSQGISACIAIGALVTLVVMRRAAGASSSS